MSSLVYYSKYINPVYANSLEIQFGRLFCGQLTPTRVFLRSKSNHKLLCCHFPARARVIIQSLLPRHRCV